MLLALSLERDFEYLAAMREAWGWTQKRKRFYSLSGARMDFIEFLNYASQEHKKQIAVTSQGRMVALVTVWLMADGEYDVHVIAPPRSSAGLLIDALLAVRDGLFNDLNASVIRSSYGTYRGHVHWGMRRILQTCGMRPIGLPWWNSSDESALYQEYEITKEMYAKSKTGINERLQVLPEAELAGA